MSWPLGLSTGIAYRHPIGQVLEAIRAAGVRTIEISTAPQHLDLDSHGAMFTLRQRLDELGLHVASLHAPFGHDVNITSPDPGLRERSFERLAAAADALATLGPGGFYVIHPGGEDQRWAWEREQRLALSVEGLTRVWRLCRERGLVLVVETPLPHLLGGQPDDFAWILERLPREGLGVCIDTSHCSLGGFLFDVVARFGSRTIHVQASDNRGSSDDHLAPGKGVIDWRRFAKALEAVAYRGCFMLEVAGDGDMSAHVHETIAAVAGVLPELVAARG